MHQEFWAAVFPNLSRSFYAFKNVLVFTGRLRDGAVECLGASRKGCVGFEQPILRGVRTEGLLSS